MFPGVPIAVVCPSVDGVEGAIRDATALGATRGSEDDLEFTIRQLVEVAVRALSPGINDPHTAIAVLDRLAVALCDLAPLHLDNGVVLRDGRTVLVVPAVSYDGLANAMLHEIRQNAAGSVSVLGRMLEVLAAVASCEHRSDRVPTLRRHAALVITDARRDVTNPADLADLVTRHDRFTVMADGGTPQLLRRRIRLTVSTPARIIRVLEHPCTCLVSTGSA